MTYTPTTREVKEWYADSIDRLGGEGEFERWLAEELRQAKEQAWEQGAESAFYCPEIRNLVDYPENPYRSKA